MTFSVKQPLLLWLLVCVIALQSLFVSADVHPAFDAELSHNAAALEHRHGAEQPLHGHRDGEYGSDHQANETATDTGDENCQHCCHCHAPTFSSLINKDLHLPQPQRSGLRWPTAQQFPPGYYSPALRPPILLS